MAKRGQLRFLIPVQVTVGVLVAVDAPRDLEEDETLSHAETLGIRDAAEEAAYGLIERKMGARSGNFISVKPREWREARAGQDAFSRYDVLVRSK